MYIYETKYFYEKYEKIMDHEFRFLYRASRLVGYSKV